MLQQLVESSLVRGKVCYIEGEDEYVVVFEPLRCSSH